MPHNTTGTNTFTNPIPTYSDGDPVAQALNDPTVQALANRDTNLTTRLAVLEALNISSRLTALESFQSTITGQNLNTRLGVVENMIPHAWGIIFLNGTSSPTLGVHEGFSTLGISGGAIRINLDVSIGYAYGVTANPNLDIGYAVPPWFFADLTTGFLLGAVDVSTLAAVNFATVTGHMEVVVWA